MARNNRVSATIGDQDVTREYYELILPHDVDIQPADRVTVNSVEYELIRFVEQHTDAVTVNVLITPVVLE